MTFDRTYCMLWERCANSDQCGRALTKEIKEKARRVNQPLSMAKFWDCFVPKNRVEGK